MYPTATRDRRASLSSARSSSRVLLAELVDATSGVEDLLFARVERVAARTNFDREILPEGRAGLDRVAAGAGHRDVLVFRVDRRFHYRATEAEACGKRARSIAAQAGRYKPQRAGTDLFTFSVDKSVEEAKKGPRFCGESAFLRPWSKNDTAINRFINNDL